MKEVKKTGDGLTVSLIPHTDQGRPQDITGVSTLLWAVGRDANLVDIGLQVTEVKLNSRGFVDVDEYQNTSVKGIYALGDVAGKKLLTPGAYGGQRDTVHVSCRLQYSETYLHRLPWGQHILVRWLL